VFGYIEGYYNRQRLHSAIGTQEAEADEIGLMYMARAGYDPRQAIALWQNMERAAGERDRSSSCRRTRRPARASSACGR
jgi:predicted Zn-dependent protease